METPHIGKRYHGQTGFGNQRVPILNCGQDSIACSTTEYNRSAPWKRIGSAGRSGGYARNRGGRKFFRALWLSFCGGGVISFQTQG
jgi:hypothetical protein